MDHITRLVDGIYVGATDPAVYAPGSPQAQTRAQQQTQLRERVQDLVAFDAATSSSILLPRSSVPWAAPATGQQYAARLAKAITLSCETPLGMQVTDCLILAVNYPQAPALEFLRSLEAGREHVVAACTRFANPDAAPRIVRGRVVHRMLHFQAQETVAAQARIFFLLALAGLVVAGEDRPLMETLRGCLTQPVLEWEPLQKHPLAHALLDDFLDLQWPADPARAWKQAVYEVQGRGPGRPAAPRATPEPVAKPRPATDEDRRAWTLCTHLGMTQTQAAELMSAETRRPWSQSKVSRACERVAAHVAAVGDAGSLPGLPPKPPRRRVVSMEPEKLEGGSGTIRTRPKESMDSDEDTTMQV